MISRSPMYLPTNSYMSCLQAGRFAEIGSAYRCYVLNDALMTLM